MLLLTDTDESGSILWAEFEAQLDNPCMLEYFKCIDIDPTEEHINIAPLGPLKGLGPGPLIYIYMYINMCRNTAA